MRVAAVAEEVVAVEAGVLEVEEVVGPEAVVSEPQKVVE
jgi:hypothetical protein